jgi:DNA-binding beta-propeller fold protein YncE
MFPDELVVIGVHSAKFPAEKITANIREAVMRHGIEHPVINDADFLIWQSYGVRAWPTLILVDPLGKVVAQHSGELMAEDLAPLLREEIERLDQAGAIRRQPIPTAPAIHHTPSQDLAYPSKLCLDPADPDGPLLYVADTGHHRILEISLDADGLGGEIRRIFGEGSPGFVDGPAQTARFHDPHGMALARGQLFVADTENHAIRAVDLATGAVSTIAGTGEKGRTILGGGPGLQTALRSPWALVAEESLLFIAMAGSHQIWLYTDGQIGVFAGNGREALVDGPRDQASFNQPSDLAYGSYHLFVADAEASAIRAIRLEDEIPVITLAGRGLFDWGDIDGRGAVVRLQHPTGIAFHDNLLYIADSYNHKIKTLDPFTGETRTLIGTGERGQADGEFAAAQLYEPEGVLVTGGHIYIADTNNHRIRVGQRQSGQVVTFMLRSG